MSSELGLTAVDATLICGFVDEKNAQYEPLRALADWVNQPPIRRAILFWSGHFTTRHRNGLERGLQRLGYLICDSDSSANLVINQQKTYKRLIWKISQTPMNFLMPFTTWCTRSAQRRLRGYLYNGLQPLVRLGLLIDGVELSTPAARYPPHANSVSGSLFMRMGQSLLTKSICRRPTDEPTNTSSYKAYRYQQLEVTRGVTKKIGSLPPPHSTQHRAYGALAATGTPVVMAGDTVQLQVESPAEAALTDDVVWIELGSRPISSIEPSDIINASGGSKATVGLLAWTELRELVVQDELQRSQGIMRSGLLSGQTKSERIIGYGPQVSWTPQCESPDVQIVVLARNQNGLWGIAKRPTPVIDLRPAVWAKPLVNVEITSGSDFGPSEDPGRWPSMFTPCKTS